jgi:AraC-like DNA-binding protein
MRFFRHVPSPPLGIFVDWLWYYDDLETDHDRQHVLPDGTFELIINLSGEPRTLFGRGAVEDRVFRHAWLSGAQSEFLVIDALPGTSMIGAHFKPGGAAPFLNMPAGEMSDAVVELEDVWGNTVRLWRERLLSARGTKAKFQVFEQLLLEQMLRCKKPRSSRRAAWALDRFANDSNVKSIRSMAEELGISHKHFIEEFRREIGLTPKLYCRIRRFQEVLARVHASKTVDWTDVALACDYYDQAHFINDFQAFSGLNPSAYLGQRTEYPNFTRAAN